MIALTTLINAVIYEREVEYASWFGGNKKQKLKAKEALFAVSVSSLFLFTDVFNTWSKPILIN